MTNDELAQAITAVYDRLKATGTSAGYYDALLIHHKELLAVQLKRAENTRYGLY